MASAQESPPTIEASRLGPGDRIELDGIPDEPACGHLISLSAELNAVRLAEGTFRTRLLRLDVNTQFSPFVSLVNRTQYDS